MWSYHLLIYLNYFPKLKKELAGYTMTQEEAIKKLVGVLVRVSREGFGKAFLK